MSPPLRNIQTALVLIGAGTEGQTALTLAHAIAKEVILVGVVLIPEGDAVSAGAQAARQIRKRLLSLSSPSTHFKIFSYRIRKTLEGGANRHCTRGA